MPSALLNHYFLFEERIEMKNLLAWLVVGCLALPLPACSPPPDDPQDPDVQERELDVDSPPIE